MKQTLAMLLRLKPACMVLAFGILGMRSSIADGVLALGNVIIFNFPSDTAPRLYLTRHSKSVIEFMILIGHQARFLRLIFCLRYLKVCSEKSVNHFALVRKAGRFKTVRRNCTPHVSNISCNGTSVSKFRGDRCRTMTRGPHNNKEHDVR
jgi:hypothetical protein